MNTPIYPSPPKLLPGFFSPVGLTFYGVLRDGGFLKGIDDDLGVTPLVRLSIDRAFSPAGPGAFRMIRDLYWEWYWTKVVMPAELDEP